MSKMPKNLKSAGSKQLKLERFIETGNSVSAPVSGAENESSDRSRSPSKDVKRKSASRINSEDEAELKNKTSKNVFPMFRKEDKQAQVSSAMTKESGSISSSSLFDEIKQKRHQLYESIAAFNFNRKRVRILSKATEIPDESQGIVYWMSRDQRVQGMSF
jgi:hypothetical protein